MERTIDRVALKKEAKRLLDGKVFKLLLCYAVYGIILAGCFALCFLTPNFLSQYFVGALENVQVISGIFTTETVQLIVWGLFLFVRVVLFMALAHPFSVCIATVPLAVAEGRIVSWKEAATPIRRLRYFIECMVTGAAQFLQTFFWAILFIVPGLLVHYRHSFTRYVFIENNDLTFGETAAQSKNLTKEFEGQLFLLDLSFLGWLLFGICTCGIGLLYLICYYSVTKVLYYKEVKKICQQESHEVPPPSGQTRVLEQQKVPTNQAPRTASHEGTESQPQGDDPQQEEAEPVAAENPTEPKEPAGHTEPNERQREAAQQQVSAEQQPEAQRPVEQQPELTTQQQQVPTEQRPAAQRPAAQQQQVPMEQEPQEKKATDATLWVDSSDKGIRIARGTMTNLSSNIAQTNQEKQEETP